MSTPVNVHFGIWRDHSKHHRHQFLANDYWATACKVAVAVILGLSGKYIYRILRNLLGGLFTYFSNNKKDPDQEPLLPHDAEHVDGGRSFLSHWLRNIRSGSVPRKYHAGALLVTTIILASFIALTVATVFSARVATDRAALLTQRQCGLFQYDDSRGDEDASRHDIAMAHRERRAGEYARNCYGSKEGANPWTCNFFYNTSISYSIPEHDRVCPFEDVMLCLGGYTTGVTFDTGLVDASVLGINFDPTPKFRRRTTCAPLNRQNPYVKHWSSKKTGQSGFHYYYGSIQDPQNTSQVLSNWTLETSGHPFDWLAPVYRLNTYTTTLEGGDAYRPIPGLQSSANSTVTIIFVSALHIVYNEPSKDKIFPANAEYTFPGERTPYYKDSDPRAKPFACVDTTWLCSPNGKICWLPNDPVPAGVKETPGYWLLKYSLEKSNTYDSIKYRLGTALLAQQKVGQARSLKIEDNQWELEAEELFKTSLARIQWDTYSIASGEDKDQAGYQDDLPLKAKGKVCGIYKLNSVGNTNIQLIPFLLLLILPLPVTFFMSRTTQEIEVWFKKEDPRKDNTGDEGDDSKRDLRKGHDRSLAGKPAVPGSSTSSRNFTGDGTISRETSRDRTDYGTEAVPRPKETSEDGRASKMDGKGKHKASTDTNTSGEGQSNSKKPDEVERPAEDEWKPVLLTTLFIMWPGRVIKWLFNGCKGYP